MIKGAIAAILIVGIVSVFFGAVLAVAASDCGYYDDDEYECDFSEWEERDK